MAPNVPTGWITFCGGRHSLLGLDGACGSTNAVAALLARVEADRENSTKAGQPTSRANASSYYNAAEDPSAHNLHMRTTRHNAYCGVRWVEHI